MTYQNPVIRGFHPDPSVCAVGEDYYAVTSSFEYFPAIPVFHSRDLINWKQIGNCITDSTQLDLRGAAESGGVWAPTIRHNHGRFYVTAAMERQGENKFGNFIIHADNITGPWSTPVWVHIGGIDPSLYFEDGKAWYCTNDWTGEKEPAIKLGVVDPDTGETLEEFRTIWHGEKGGWMEAPHLYRIGGWYYILCAEGGTGNGHHEIVGRSKEIRGPYENCPHNPVLTNRGDTTKEVSCSGHGDLIRDRHGNWWMLHLGCRPGLIDPSPLGRETFLTPVKWENGWPVIREGKARRMEYGYGGSDSVEQIMTHTYTDNFIGTEWLCWWSFVRNPDDFRFVRGGGKLSFFPNPGKPDAKNLSGFVCTPQPDLNFCMAVTLTFRPESDGDSAGLMIYLTHDFYLFWGLRCREGRRELFLERKIEDIDFCGWSEPYMEAGVRLWVKGTKENYSFGIFADECGERQCAEASSRFLSPAVVGRCFTGTMAGLYAERMTLDGQSGRDMAEFSDFFIMGSDRDVKKTDNDVNEKQQEYETGMDSEQE